MNCLVDLTSAATGVSVRQMRGRSLRLDPADPEKVASNWDVVCVAPRHAQGDADYERFVRKHRHLHAPADDGTLEAGVGHVHPDLSPFAPPPAEHFAEIARAMTLRAADRDSARARWRIGAPYEGHEIETLVLHARRPGAAPPRRPPGPPPRLRIGERGLLGGCALALAGAVGGALAAGPLLLAGLLPAAGLAAAALRRTRRPRRSCPRRRRWTASRARSATRTSRSASCVPRRPRRSRSSRAPPATSAAGCAMRNRRRPPA